MQLAVNYVTENSSTLCVLLVCDALLDSYCGTKKIIVFLIRYSSYYMQIKYCMLVYFAFV
jgi:hypothetical protein